MFMKEGMNKKGEFTTAQLLGLILGVVAVALVIIFATGGFAKIGELFEKVPSIEITAQACGGYANANLVNAYCNEFYKTKILGESQWVTCEYLANNSLATFDKLTEECSQTASVTEFCETLTKKNIEVNGQDCPQ